MEKEKFQKPYVQAIQPGFDSFRPDGITYVPKGHSEFCKKIKAASNEEQARIDAQEKFTETRIIDRSGRNERP